MYRATEIKSKEGERCGNTAGPLCEEGLTCIGKIQLVNGLGTCRQIGTYDFRFQVFLIVTRDKIINFVVPRNKIIKFTFREELSCPHVKS